jgi:hypothetical protein
MARAARNMPVVKAADPVARHLPGLVEGAPPDDRGVRVVALQDLQPLRDVAGVLALVVVLGAAAGASPVGELPPDEVAQPVRVEEEALLEHFLVQARAVEAGCLRELDIAPQVVVRRCRPDAVGVEALVEHESLEQDLSINKDRDAVDRDGTQPGVASAAVDHRAGSVDELELEVVEVGIPGRPGPSRRGGDREIETRNEVRIGGALPGADSGAVAFEVGVHSHASPVADDGKLQAEPAARQVGGDPGTLEPCLGDGLHPHRLPDARRPGVVAARVREGGGLLALGLGGTVVVASAHDDECLVSRLRDSREVRRDRRRAAAVTRHFHTVHPDRRVVVDRLEMQECPAPLPRGR